MARTSKSLDDKTIRALKAKEAPYRVSDGGGLLLQVLVSGAKTWICRLSVDGKRRDMGLGGYPTVSLAAARVAALAARQGAQKGADPVEARAAEKAARIAARQAREAKAARTFEAVAAGYLKAEEAALSPRTLRQWRGSFALHVYPVIGALPVDSVDRDAVMRAVAPVATKPEMAKKLSQRIGAVLRHAAARGWRANDNPADRRMLRLAGLPAMPPGGQHASLQWQRVPAFLSALDDVGGLGALALRFAILTASRSGEARGARWSELYFEGRPAWVVPGARMKGRALHRVPLTPAALDALSRAFELAHGVVPDDLARQAALMGDALIFPSAKRTTALSDMALSAVVKRMNAAGASGALPMWRDAEGKSVVPHGFRASFRTWVDDTRPEDATAAEAALAHKEPNRVVGAHRRSDLFDRREGLMAAWTAHCCAPAAAAKVVRLEAQAMA
ncbi:MAG: hypothetical protein JWO24_770 [Rhodospirillales bacterium]|nr:hypothetical protein [Rhodospirillales bacterium]